LDSISSHQYPIEAIQASSTVLQANGKVINPKLSSNDLASHLLPYTGRDASGMIPTFSYLFHTNDSYSDSSLSQCIPPSRMSAADQWVYRIAVWENNDAYTLGSNTISDCPRPIDPQGIDTGIVNGQILTETCFYGNNVVNESEPLIVGGKVEIFLMFIFFSNLMT